MKVTHAEALQRAAPLPAVSPAIPARPPPPEGRPFAEVLAGLGRRLDEGERTMKAVTLASKGSHDPGELLALQAQVYRYVEAVDLTTKLVDRATNAVKTTLQGQ